MKVIRDRALEFYKKNEVIVSISVFVAGFLFDLLTLGRIDDLLNLMQQAIYLIVLGVLLVYEIKVKTNKVVLTGNALKFWEYHDLVVHFLFGSLLSAYTIFYYTSASALTSLLFIGFLAGLMLANEFPQIQKLGLPVRVILYTICNLSYFAFFYPILMGHVGALPFWLGFLTSGAVMLLVWKTNFEMDSHTPVLRKHVAIPAVVVHAVFLIGYYFALIPPVPVAVKKIGVYYAVEKTEGRYIGKHLSPFWKIWSKGSQKFLTREGDKVFVLLSVFSPARFEDKIFLKWYHDDPRHGWKLEDTIPLNILGGRDEGFRGFGSKQFYTLGDWRVVVETSDGREVGRIGFTIAPDPEATERIFKNDVY